MSTDVSSAENEGGATVRTARVPKYYRLKRHLLDMTETHAARHARSRRSAPWPPSSTPRARPCARPCRNSSSRGGWSASRARAPSSPSPRSPRRCNSPRTPRTCAPRAWNPPPSCWTSATSPPTTPLAGLLDITAGGRVLRIERLRLASGEPMAIETTHLSREALPRAAPQPGQVHLPLHRAGRGVRRPPGRGRGDHRDLAGHPARGRTARHRRGPADADALPALAGHGRASRWSGCGRSTGATGTSSSPACRRPSRLNGPLESHDRVGRAPTGCPLISVHRWPVPVADKTGRPVDSLRIARRWTGRSVEGTEAVRHARSPEDETPEADSRW